MTNAALRGKPDAGNPHVRFDVGGGHRRQRRGVGLYFYLAGLMVSGAITAAQAATNTNWIDDPDNRGTEANPVNLYDKTRWESGELPSSSWNLNFTAAGRTYITNTASASTQIATALRFLGGDFVVSGSMSFNSFGYNASETAPVSIDKRGNWTCPRDFYLATAANSSFVFTNRTGKLDICEKNPARIGVGDNSTAALVIEDGAFTGSSSTYHCSIAYGAGSMGCIEQNGGTLSMAGRLQIGFGTNSTGRYVQNGGTASVSSDLYVGYNGAGELTINDGTFTAKSKIVFGANGGSSFGNIVLNGGTLAAKRIECSSSQGSTILFDGGTIKAYSDGVLIAAHDGLSVTAGPGGGTINAAGKSVTIEESISGAGGMSFVGGGSVAITNGNTYAGATTVEIGTVLHIPGPADFPASFVVAVPAAAPQDGVYTVAVIDGEGEFPSVPDGIAKPANVKLRLSADFKSILCIYGDPPNTWIGGASGSLSEDRNWSLGYVPTSGDSCFIGSGAEADLTVGSLFAPDVITFTSDSASVTISGENAISGVTVITNLSSVNHTINVPVRFSDKILVVQNAKSWESRTKSSVCFAGGVSGANFATGTARCLNGHYVISDGSGWVATGYGYDNRWGIPEGGSLTIPVATNTSQLAVGQGDSTVIAGGAFTAGVVRTSARISMWNQGEYVVTDELAVTLPGSDLHLSNQKSSGAFKFEKVTLGDNGSSWSFYFANSADKYYEKNVWVGAGGLNFAEGASPATVYRCGRMNNSGEITYIRPWHSDYAIGTKPGATRDVLVNHPTHFGTTDENGVARTVTCNGIVEGTSTIYVDGAGRFVVNAVNTHTGSWTVNDTATLAINAGKKVTTGAITVNGGATLEVAESGTVALAGNLTLKNNAQLGFNFTGSTMPVLDLAGKTVTFETGETTNIVVKISPNEGKRGRSGALTAGGKFTGVNVSLADGSPEWATGVSVVNGDVVLAAKPTGLIVIIN